ncbi:MAG: YidC/Oxa1 family membrane protein insertase [Actinobacteria bacterium]|nr:YidC/Oxa1 family membrane protein insertase [Actinomycetota bacterium]
MNPLDLLEAPLRAVLDFFHGIGFTWGWAIVMLTVLVRLILLPLFVKQYKSARRMQEVAPQMKELQRKYKGNKKKLQEEMMNLYKENDVNPFGSCLPLLLQAPVFIALYYTLRGQDFADGTDVSFMYVVPDVSKLLTEIGWAVIPLIAVYALSQLISSELSATANMSKNQRWLMRLLPIGIVFFIFQFPVPAGLVIYWATTNLWTAGQQLVLKRRIEAEIEASGGSLLTPRSQDTDGADEADGPAGADDGDDAGDAADTMPAAAAAAVATEDVEVRTKALPRRRGRKKKDGAEAPAAGANGGAAAPDAPAVAAGEANGTTEARVAPGGDGGADITSPGPDGAGGGPAGSKEIPQGGGPKKRKPPARKVKGGPGRPASRKPPKRRK